MPATDGELIERFRRGESHAFELLVRRWSDRVVDLAFRMTGDREIALDVRQAAFLRALRGLDRFDAAARFSTWMYRIVLNLCIDHRRRKTARGQDNTTSLDEASGEVATGADPAAFTEREETARLVAAAVASLPPPVRIVVVLKHYRNLTFAEIAEILETPTSTVKSRMSQGLEALRTRLGHAER